MSSRYLGEKSKHRRKDGYFCIVKHKKLPKIIYLARGISNSLLCSVLWKPKVRKIVNWFQLSASVSPVITIGFVFLFLNSKCRKIYLYQETHMKSFFVVNLASWQVPI